MTNRIKIGDRVYYDHKGRHRLGADVYSEAATVMRVGKRVTIHTDRLRLTRIVSVDNLRPILKDQA